MNIDRIKDDMEAAIQQFPQFKPFLKGGIYSLIGFLQTNSNNVYKCQIIVPRSYPNSPPKAFTIQPTKIPFGPHMWRDGQLCLFKNERWNPGKHDLEFIIARVAKWLNKYEVWKVKKIWPGKSADEERRGVQCSNRLY